MKDFLTICKFAVGKRSARTECEKRESAINQSERFDQSDRNWVEDFLVGASDQDAIWYYERRRWRA